VRHPVYVGIREDKTARQVVREVADPGAKREVFKPRLVRATALPSLRAWKGAVPSRRR
jgi:hypothetical protein